MDRLNAFGISLKEGSFPARGLRSQQNAVKIRCDYAKSKIAKCRRAWRIQKMHTLYDEKSPNSTMYKTAMLVNSLTSTDHKMKILIKPKEYRHFLGLGLIYMSIKHYLHYNSLFVFRPTCSFNYLLYLNAINLRRIYDLPELEHTIRIKIMFEVVPFTWKVPVINTKRSSCDKTTYVKPFFTSSLFNMSSYINQFMCIKLL